MGSAHILRDFQMIWWALARRLHGEPAGCRMLFRCSRRGSQGVFCGQPRQLHSVGEGVLDVGVGVVWVSLLDEMLVLKWWGDGVMVGEGWPTGVKVWWWLAWSCQLGFLDR